MSLEDLRFIQICYLIICFSGENCITLPGEVQVKVEPFSDVQVEQVHSISLGLFTKMNEVIGEVKIECEREVKLEVNQIYEQENEDSMV